MFWPKFRSRKPSSPRSSRQLSRRPFVESLEDRNLLTIIHVGPAETFTSIQAGVNAASAGDEVQIDTGTYVEQVTITKSLTLDNAPGAAPIIQAPTSLVANFGAGDATNALVAIGGAGVTVDVHGFTIEGPVATSPLDPPPAAQTIDAGVYVAGGATGNIHNNFIINIANDPLNSTAPTGSGVLVGRDVTNTQGSATIANNTISGYQKTGISVENASSATISGNTITGSGPITVLAQNGILFTNGSTGSITSNTVSGNEFQGNGTAPGGSDPTVDTQAGGIVLLDAGAGVSVTSNTVDANDVGIYSFNRATTTPVAINSNLVGLNTANRYEGILAEQGNASITSDTVKGGVIGIAVISFNGSTGDSIANISATGVSGANIGVRIFDDQTGGGTTHNPIVTINAPNPASGLGSQIFSNAVGVQIEAGTTKVLQSYIFSNSTVGILVLGGTLSSVDQTVLDLNGGAIDVQGGTVGAIFDNQLNSTNYAITNNTNNVITAGGNYFGGSLQNPFTPANVAPLIQGSGAGLVNTLGFFTFGGDSSSAPGYQGDLPERFLATAYIDLFNRFPDYAGEQNFLAQLGGPLQTNPTRTFQQVATSLASGAEYYTDQIIQYYERFLGRAPSLQETQNQIASLFPANSQPTATLQQVEANILASPEFFGLAGGTNSGYVQRLYEVVLGRPADSNLASFVNLLNTGTSRAQLAFDFINTPEAYNLLLNNPAVITPPINNVTAGIPIGYYEQFLRRQAAAGEDTGFINQLLSGSSTPGTGTGSIPNVISEFLSSDEFLNVDTLF